MKILKYLTFTVVMVCLFAGGFYIGTRSVLDDEITHKIAEPFLTYHTISLEAFNLKASSDELTLLFHIKNGVSVDKFIEGHRDLVKNNIKTLENALREHPNESDNEVFLYEIERAKKLLSK